MKQKVVVFIVILSIVLLYNPHFWLVSVLNAMDRSVIVKKENSFNPDVLNPTLFTKHNAVTSRTRNSLTYALCPHKRNLLFTPFQNRGDNNARKIDYMIAGFSQSKMIELRPQIRSMIATYVVSGTFNDTVLQMLLKLQQRVFYGRELSNQDDERLTLFAAATGTKFYTNAWNFQRFRRRFKRNLRECSVNSMAMILRAKGFHDDELFHEYTLLCLAIVNNLAITTAFYLNRLSLGTIPYYNESENITIYAYEVSRLASPADVNSVCLKSGERNQQDIFQQSRDPKVFGPHADKFSMHHYNKSDLVYNTTLNTVMTTFDGQSPGEHTILLANQSILQKSGYVAYGNGHRRCAGEQLGIVYIEELARYFVNYRVQLDKPLTNTGILTTQHSVLTVTNK